MVKVSVLYPNREGTKFDMAYYLNHHIPMVRQLLGSALKGVSVEQIACPVCHDVSSAVRFSSSLPNKLRHARAGDHGRHPEVHELRASHSDRRSPTLAFTDCGILPDSESAILLAR